MFFSVHNVFFQQKRTWQVWKKKLKGRKQRLAPDRLLSRKVAVKLCAISLHEVKTTFSSKKQLGLARPFIMQLGSLK
jgi:hypothetical protein